MPDAVTNPSHYAAGEYECKDVQDALAGTLWSGNPKVVRLGNALKYLWRCNSKGKFEEDVRKAAFELLSAIDEEWRMRAAPGHATPELTDAKTRTVIFLDEDGDRVELDCLGGGRPVVRVNGESAWIERKWADQMIEALVNWRKGQTK